MKRITALITLSTALICVQLVRTVNTQAQAVSSTGESGTNLEVLGARAVATPTPTPPPLRKAESKDPFVNARQYALFEPESGTLLIDGNASAQVPVASTTKLMTLLVTLNAGIPSEGVVSISPESASSIGSQANLRSGDSLTLYQLLETLMLVSANDGAEAIAEHVGRVLLNDLQASHASAVSRFVEEMNSTATSLGMKETRFLDPAGLNDEGMSSARDLALLAAELLKHHENMVTTLSTTSEKTIASTGGASYRLVNSNRLAQAPQFTGLVLGKTGFTPTAGHCLVAAATRDGMTLISVILSTYEDTKTASAEQTRNLLSWGFENYTANSQVE